MRSLLLAILISLAPAQMQAQRRTTPLPKKDSAVVVEKVMQRIADMHEGSVVVFNGKRFTPSQGKSGKNTVTIDSTVLTDNRDPIISFNIVGRTLPANCEHFWSVVFKRSGDKLEVIDFRDTTPANFCHRIPG